MPQITDSLGTWDNLGIITLSTDWQIFQATIIATKVIRFTYLYDLEEWEAGGKYKAYIISRFYYPGVNQIVSPSFRLYPKPEQEIRLFPGNESVLNLGAKKIFYTKKFNFTNLPSIIIRLQAEALL